MRSPVIKYLFLLFTFLPLFFHGQTKILDSLNTLLSKASSDNEQMRLLNVIAEEDDDFKRSLITANKAMQLANKLNDHQGLSLALNTIGFKYYNNNFYSDAVGYLERAYKSSIKSNDTLNQSSALLNIGRCYYELGDFQRAQYFLTEQIKLLPGIKNNFEIVSNYNTMAAIYLDQANFKKAHEFYMKEIAVAEKNNMKSIVAQAYNNLANVYDEQGKFDKALEYYLKDLQITKDLGNEEDLSTTYNNLGSTYLSLKEYEKARINIEKAVEIAERLNYKYGLSIYYSSLGNYYEEVGKFDKALYYYQKDLENAKLSGTKNNLANSYQTLADFFLKIKKPEEAKENYLQALKISREVNALNIISNVNKGLAELYAMQGDFRNAYAHQVLYKTFYDSIFTLESEKNVSEISTRYESEKKEQTITLLNKERELKNTEIKKQKLIRYSFTIGFILMLVLVFVVYKSSRAKHAANKLLSLQKQEIEIKNSELHSSKNELQKQKDLVDQKQKEIVDSINYAQRIQYTLLANDAFLKEHLRDYFVIFKPKDIVSGDFYWAASASGKQNAGSAQPQAPNCELFYLAVCDSTGHGVPGAFMSLLSIGFLSEAINEKGIREPNKIFDYVRMRLVENVSKETQKDGFDGLLLCIDNANKQITYASANTKGITIKNGILTELKTDKMPVGAGEKQNEFSLFKMDYSEGAMLYLFTDGYADQFGGPVIRRQEGSFGKGKKYKTKQLQQLLLNVAGKELSIQKQIIDNSFNEWKGDLEQVDDVCLVGFKL
ncbi:MAG: protein serine/threonine phosphatase [Bacteroidetes bacterium]|nr:protein serine/threonine phosphatase [Bacteroidota bacterium]